MNTPAAPLGGKMTGPRTLVVAGLAVVGLALIIWRFAVGLGPSTGLSDGYPWGLWIAFDVVTGTALACGGYAVALLVYVFNQGRYHPLVRPAILTSALGYTMASIAIIIDVGRPWFIWRIPIAADKWNLDSALLEVALCVMAYMVVLWIEVSPAFLQKWGEAEGHPFQKPARFVGRNLERALPFIIGLGLVLPTMHQSSLGTVMLLAGPRLHPLFNSAWVPLFFLMTCLAMGWAMVVLEASLVSLGFDRRVEHRMLRRLSLPIGVLLAVFLVARFADLVWSGKLGHLVELSAPTFAFWLEILLFGLGTWWMLFRRSRLSLGRLFQAAVFVVTAGALYRFDTYLVAFQPSGSWVYFPTVPEIFISVGLVAIEIFLYLLLVRRFPILGGVGANARRQLRPGVSHG